MESTDTIAAIASGRATSGVGIIRLSGSQSIAIAQAICQLTPTPRYAHYTQFGDQHHQIIDNGLLIYFKSPHSFTGEDVIEFHCHGGLVIMDVLLTRCIELGARFANPGEFSQRAFLNNKIDLCQTEALADLINASTKQAALAASQSLSGVFSKKLDNVLNTLYQIRIELEAGLDFPDEELDLIDNQSTIKKIAALIVQLEQLIEQTHSGSLLVEGNRVVISGKPNVGKSTLLNRLSGEEHALVSDIAGTTRDSISVILNLGGVPVQLMDTAGLHQTDDPIETLGIQKSWQHIKNANVQIYLMDASQLKTNNILHSVESDPLLQQINAEKKNTLPILVVINKTDLLPKKNWAIKCDQYRIVGVSSLDGTGFDAFKQALIELMGFNVNSDFSARTRHQIALKKSLTRVQSALTQLSQPEVCAEDLKYAQNSLSEIKGTISSDELLGKIFSSFCIGK